MLAPIVMSKATEGKNTSPPDSCLAGIPPPKDLDAARRDLFPDQSRAEGYTSLDGRFGSEGLQNGSGTEVGVLSSEMQPQRKGRDNKHRAPHLSCYEALGWNGMAGMGSGVALRRICMS